MRKNILTFICFILISLTPSFALAATFNAGGVKTGNTGNKSGTATNTNTSTGAQSGSSSLSCSSGVLVRNATANPCTNKLDFNQYVTALLSQLVPLILFLALIMIIFSGVQYMLGGNNPENQKVAKQRILGILGGVIFFVLARFILNQIAGDIFL